MSKLIVLSMDALIYEDLAKLEKMPNFAWLMENGARANRLKCIYPTLTYPCHTTMASGCYPDKHGITNNSLAKPGIKDLPWNWTHENVKVKDLFDAAKAAGLTTAAVGWPVTGNHPSVDYEVDEIWAYGEDKSMAAWEKAFLDTGTTRELYDAVVSRYMPLRVKRHQPESLRFLINCACDIITLYQPDLLMIHPANIDHYRHVSGVFSDMVDKGLVECDGALGQIIAACQAAGTLEDTDIVVTSDHGQLDLSRMIRPNVLFRENGLIDVDENGNVTDWQAWCYPVGMSAQVHLKNPSDKAVYDKVYSLLNSWCSTGLHGIERVFTADEVEKEYRLAGDFTFYLESDGYTKFDIDWDGPYCVSFPIRLANAEKASHGFLPEKGPRPVLLGCGPHFRKGAILEDAHLVDGAPTYAKILGVELPDADGRALTELLNE